jgi:hypothetical protein
VEEVFATLETRFGPVEIPPICAGCGRVTEEIPQETADLLARLEGREGSHSAYGCQKCEVVIFEDELVEGEFVPHDFRPLRTARVESRK